MSLIDLTLLFTLLYASISAASPPHAARPAPARIEVMTFNIRFGTADDDENHWRHRGDFCIDLIGRRGRDFVGLQEALRFQIDAIRASHPRFGETGVGRDDGQSAGEHCAILYDQHRWSIDDERCSTFWLSDTPDEIGSKSWGNAIPRIVTWARFIERSTGRGVWVFNTHFDHQSQPSREKSAILLMERIASRDRADEPVIVMGDFNAGESNPAMRYLTGEIELEDRRVNAPLIDSFRAIHPDVEMVGTFTGFDPGRTDGEKIDAILVPPGVRVNAAEIVRERRDDRWPSDHFPVTATLRW